MTEAELKAILARNPQISARDNSTLCQIFAQEPEPGTAQSLEESQLRNSQSQDRPFVCFVFRRTRPLDPDAVSGAGKDLLDGLQDAGLIPGDAEEQICYEAVQQKVGKVRDEGTYIFIATGKEGAQLATAQQDWREYLLTRLIGA